MAEKMGGKYYWAILLESWCLRTGAEKLGYVTVLSKPAF